MSEMLDKLLKAGLVSDDAAQKARVAAEEAERQSQEAQRATRPPRPGRPNTRGRGDYGSGGGDRDGRPTQRRARPTPQPLAAVSDDSPEAQAKATALAESGRVDGLKRGGRRFYYEARSGRVPFVEVTPDAAQSLAKGGAGLVETPDGDVWLVDDAAARSIAAVDSAWLRAHVGR